MKYRRREILHPFLDPLLLSCCAGIALLPGCRRGQDNDKEMAYVSAPQAVLRDQVALVYNKTGSVKNGEAVKILGRDRRFARVRTSAGAEGWLEQRYLVSQETYDAFQKLAAEVRNHPVQATAVAHNQTNIHLEPQRDAEHLYQVDQGARLSLLKRPATKGPFPGGQARARQTTPKPRPPVAHGRLVAGSR